MVIEKLKKIEDIHEINLESLIDKLPDDLKNCLKALESNTEEYLRVENYKTNYYREIQEKYFQDINILIDSINSWIIAIEEIPDLVNADKKCYKCHKLYFVTLTTEKDCIRIVKKCSICTQEVISYKY